MNFDLAFSILVDPSHEGGYSNNPADPGEETYKGVSRKNNQNWAGWPLLDSHKVVDWDVPDSTHGSTAFNQALAHDLALQESVKSLYRTAYWTSAGCDTLPDLLKYEMFDLTVNTGQITAIRLLQQALGSGVDGMLGPKTLQAAQTLDPAKALRRLQALRMRYYTALADSWWNKFGRGLMNRVATNMMNA